MCIRDSAGDENEFLRQAFMADFGVSEEEATANAIAGSSIDTDTLMENYTYSYSTSLGGTECADWLFDSSRSYGDTTAITYNDSYSCVLFYISREDNDYNMVNVRHILITPEETESTGDEEADAAAEQAAKDAALSLIHISFATCLDSVHQSTGTWAVQYCVGTSPLANSPETTRLPRTSF